MEINMLTFEGNNRANMLPGSTDINGVTGGYLQTIVGRSVEA